MKIEKRGNSYRVRITENGVIHSMSFKTKPTRQEIMIKFNSLKKTCNNGELISYINNYIDSQSNILSPSTIKGYKLYANRIEDKLKHMNINAITQDILQRFINVYALNHSAKTCQNMFNLINVVLETYRPEFVYRVSLPKRVKKDDYIPTMEDIKLILQEAYPTKYFTALLLACFGLRRSEIIALTQDDIYDTYISINKAKVSDENNNWILKSTKNYHERIVYMPESCIRVLRERGLYDGEPNQIFNFLKRTEKKLGLPEFSLHKLRHFYASLMHMWNMPQKYIMAQGGWITDKVLSDTYQHTFENERKEITAKINSKYEKNLVHFLSKTE